MFLALRNAEPLGQALRLFFNFPSSSCGVKLEKDSSIIQNGKAQTAEEYLHQFIRITGTRRTRLVSVL
jgi:hypothetical protein